MKCIIEYTNNKYLKKLGINTQEMFELFCKDAVQTKLWETQFKSYNPLLKPDKLPSRPKCAITGEIHENM